MMEIKRDVPKSPERKYLRHKQIKGDCFFTDPNLHEDPSECLVRHHICATLGPIEYQEAINDCLDILLDYCLTKTEAHKIPAKLQRF